MSRSRRSALATLLLLCALHAGPLARGAAARPVAGKVTDMAGRGLEGAHVTAQDPQAAEPVSAVTDAEGRFRLETPDGAGLSFTAPGRLRVEVPAEAVSSQMTVALPLASGLVVRVRDADTERPVPGALISILGRDGDLRKNGDREPLRTATSDKDGRAALDGLPPGIYDLRAEVDGYEAGNLRSVRLLPEARPTVRVRMDRLYTLVLEGKVTDPEGKPVEGARVGLLRRADRGGGGSRPRSPLRVSNAVETDADGRYRVEVRSTAPERFWQADPWPGALVAAASGRAPALETRSVPPEDARFQVNFTLGPAAEVRGRVEDEEGTSVAAIYLLASIRLPYTNPDTGKSWTMLGVDLPSLLPDLDEETGVVTDADGRFRIPGLPTGTVHLRPWRRGYPPAEEKEVETAAGRLVEDVVLSWREGASIRGDVVDGTGAPVPGARVLALARRRTKAQISAGVETDGEGTFRIGGLDPHAAFRLTARAEGFGPEDIEGVRPGGEPLRIRLRRAGTLSGVAYDAETGEPVQVFGLTRQPHRSGEEERGTSESEIFSAPEGTFRWEGVAAGLYRLQVHAPGYLPQERDAVEVRPSEETPVEPFHLSRGKEVRGHVLDLDGMAPVAGASVRATAVSLSGAAPPCCPPRGLGGPGQAVTDEEGAFRVSGLPPGEIRVVAESPGRARAGVAVRVGKDDPASEVEILMGPGASVEASLEGEDEAGGPDMSLRYIVLEPVDDLLRAIQDRAMRRVREGRPVVFERVPPGRYRLYARGVAAKERSLDLRHGDDVQVSLEPAGTFLAGKVLRSGEAVEDARVGLMPDPGSGRMDMPVACRTERGAFECGPLASGTWMLIAGTENAKSQVPELVRTIEIPEGEGRMEMDVVLPDRVFSGRLVRDDDGEGLAGVGLLLLDPSAGGFSSIVSAASTDEGGTFEMTVSRPGTYRLVVDSAGAGMDGWVLRGDGSVKVPEDGLRGQVLRLGPSGGVTGRVTGPDGHAVEGAVVLPLHPEITAMFGGLPLLPPPLGAERTVTDMDGRFEIGSAPPGTVLDVTAPGLASVWAPVPEDRSAPFEVSLSSGASLELLLPEPFSDSSAFRLTLETNGLPMPIVLTPFLMESPADDRVSILATGSLLLSHVPPGAWSVRVRLGEREWSRTVELEDGSPFRLDFSD